MKGYYNIKERYTWHNYGSKLKTVSVIKLRNQMAFYMDIRFFKLTPNIW